VPAPVLAWFKAAKSLKDLFGLIETGEIAFSLGDIEMATAKTAFNSVPRTLDKRGQVWECISHLNSAQHAYEQFIRDRAYGNMTITRVNKESDANVKRRFTLVLKAVCYRYLNEQRMCQEALELAKREIDAERPPALGKAEGILGLGYMLASAATGVIFAELGYMAVKGIGQAKDEYGVDEATFDHLVSLLSD